MQDDWGISWDDEGDDKALAVAMPAAGEDEAKDETLAPVAKVVFFFIVVVAVWRTFGESLWANRSLGKTKKNSLTLLLQSTLRPMRSCTSS